MIDHATENGYGTWGVSHNDLGVILKVCSYKLDDRVSLSPQEVEILIANLRIASIEYLFQCEEE